MPMENGDLLLGDFNWKAVYAYEDVVSRVKSSSGSESRVLLHGGGDESS
jgi:hypothetical protein